MSHPVALSAWTVLAAVACGLLSAEAQQQQQPQLQQQQQLQQQPQQHGAQGSSPDPILARVVLPPPVLPTALAEAPPPPPVQPAPPDPPPSDLNLSTGSELGILSRYIWRGFQLDTALSLQPTYWVKVGNALTVSTWMNAARHQATGPLTEHDLTVDYSRTVKTQWTLSAGWINYVFPGTTSDRVSNEIYGGVSHASWANPTLKVYQDVHAGSGTYINLSGSHTFPLGRGFTATPAIGLGYNHQQWIDESLFSDLNIGVRVLVPTPWARLSLAPSINYSYALTDKVPSLTNHLYGGLGIVTRF